MLAAASYAVWHRPASAPSVVLPQRLVVLPFVNQSPEPENEFFSDGLTEELTNVLARVDGLQVVARTSASQFKGKNYDARTIGQMLKVGALLEGSVRKSGSTLRVIAYLVNAADGYQLWSQEYERRLTDVFALQEEIAQAIAVALKVTQTGKSVQGETVKNTMLYEKQ